MPPKAKVKKKSAKEKKKDEEMLKITRKLRELEKAYEHKCATDHSLCHSVLKKSIRISSDSGKHLAKIILDDEISDDGMKVKLAPIIAAIRSIRYTFIKEIYVWDIHVKYEDLAALSNFLEQPVYITNYIEFMDCKIDAFSMERFSKCLSTSTSLTALVLDYNTFGDEGCRYLCSGLEGNKTLLKLSLNYCDLKTESGAYLGKVVSETAIRDLYLNGNKLECEGLIELIKMIVDKAELETIQRQQEKKDETTNNEKPLLRVKTSMSEMATKSTTQLNAAGERSRTPNASAKSPGSARKKKRRKSAKKKPEPKPAKVGPWLEKLHIENNGIDSYGIAVKLAPVLCMRLVKKWIANSADLKELNIDDNLIGDLGGREILNGLQRRKQAGLDAIKIWITHRMHPDTFSKILTLGSGGGKKKKKKKGKPGKKRV